LRDLVLLAMADSTTHTTLCITAGIGRRPAHRAETSGMASEIRQTASVVVHGLISIRLIGLCQRVTRRAVLIDSNQRIG
jgi:hypothetical protein